MSRRRKGADDHVLTGITDEAMLSLVIGGVLASSKPIRRLTKKVLRAQRRLRARVSRKGWAEYLALEEVVNERASMEVELIARWAFAAGTRGTVR